MTAKLKRNAVHCLNCGTTIESRHVHDFRRCACPDEQDSVFVDGGLAYLRMGAGYRARYTSLVEYEDEGAAQPHAQ